MEVREVVVEKGVRYALEDWWWSARWWAGLLVALWVVAGVVDEGGSEYGRKRCGERLGPRRIVFGRAYAGNRDCLE